MKRMPHLKVGSIEQVSSPKDINDLTGKVIGAAIEVHKALGPGLLESAYEECLSHELQLRNLIVGIALMRWLRVFWS